jgi:hypothetical protein
MKMETQVDTRRIVLFLSLAFGIAWLTGLIIYLTGGLTNSPQIGSGISLALILLAVPYMWAPAVAHILADPRGVERCRPTPAFPPGLAVLANGLGTTGTDDHRWRSRVLPGIPTLL